MPTRSLFASHSDACPQIAMQAHGCLLKLSALPGVTSARHSIFAVGLHLRRWFLKIANY
jgi:hypothetical protein